MYYVVLSHVHCDVIVNLFKKDGMGRMSCLLTNLLCVCCDVRQKTNKVAFRAHFTRFKRWLLGLVPRCCEQCIAKRSDCHIPVPGLCLSLLAVCISWRLVLPVPYQRRKRIRTMRAEAYLGTSTMKLIKVKAQLFPRHFWNDHIYCSLSRDRLKLELTSGRTMG
jgi:hypothetical protein